VRYTLLRVHLPWEAFSHAACIHHCQCAAIRLDEPVLLIQCSNKNIRSQHISPESAIFHRLRHRAPKMIRVVDGWTKSVHSPLFSKMFDVDLGTRAVDGAGRPVWRNFGRCSNPTK